MHKILSSAIVAAALISGSSATLAAPTTHSLSIVVDTSSSFPVTTLLDGDGYINWDVYGISYDPFSFAMNEGDTISIDVTTTGPGLKFDEVDGVSRELMRVNGLLSNPGWNIFADNPTFLPVITYSRTSTLTVTGFSGDLNASSFTSSLTESLTTPSYALGVAGNFTDTSVTLTSFNISSTFTGITLEPGFESYDNNTTFAINPTTPFLTSEDWQPVPTPGAMALLGAGLFGLVLRRRTA